MVSSFLRNRAAGWAAGFTAFAVCFGSAALANAAHYESIVIDAATGQVISQYNADTPTYPASLTKIMTLYLTFEALQHHQITLDTRFPVSAHAAAQEPTKLNLHPGDSVTVRDLILGIVTQSANDAAVTLAEGLGGSEHAFAAKMTAKARALGMENTYYDNASGLPDPLQRSTARDIATLARHLYQDFPQDYAYFATRTFTYHGVTYSNHNHLMSAFAGMDGIKTGFIRASGFNLAASAVRNGRRLIGVEMGGVSAHARDMKMAELLNAAFDGRPSPDIMMASAETKTGPSHAALHAIARRAVGTLAKLAPIARAEAATPSRFVIQVGAYRGHREAAHAGTTARAKAPAIKGKPVVVVASHSGHKTIYSVRIIDLTASQARQACESLHHAHRDCAVLGSLQVAGQKAGGSTPQARS